VREIVWVGESVVLALHEEHLAEHSGALGLHDPGLLKSALFPPRHLMGYDTPDFAALAAAYVFGLARNHPFVDGNKRTAFTVTELFLALNGQELIADDASCVLTMVQTRSGRAVGRGLSTMATGAPQPPGGALIVHKVPPSRRTGLECSSILKAKHGARSRLELCSHARSKT
jgi:death-on-curing protein